MTRKYKYLYGPVPSRRIGLSLGVDILKPKYCTLDCIYCQLRRTDHLTIERQSFVPPDEILEEIRLKLAEEEVQPDYITFSGSGEPTLSSDIGYLIRGIKSFIDVSVAVLTNSTLIWMPEVREELKPADLIVPSMDGALQHIFEKVNRPHPELDIEKIKEGLLEFASGFEGKIWLEILLVSGVNDSDENISALVEYVEKLKPEKIQLNTVVRPPVEKDSAPVIPERLNEIARLFTPEADVVAGFIPKDKREKALKTQREAIFNMIRRRPCSAIDIKDALQYHEQEVMKALRSLEEEGRIVKRPVEGKEFFSLPEE